MPLTNDGRLHRHVCLESCVMSSEVQLATTCMECSELWPHMKYVLGKLLSYVYFPIT